MEYFVGISALPASKKWMDERQLRDPSSVPHSVGCGKREPLQSYQRAGGRWGQECSPKEHAFTSGPHTEESMCGVFPSPVREGAGGARGMKPQCPSVVTPECVCGGAKVPQRFLVPVLGSKSHGEGRAAAF